MKIIPSIILSFTLLGIWGCSDSGEPIIEGCMDANACNHNIEANKDAANCIYDEDVCGTCGGTIANVENCCLDGQEPDCFGSCGGSAVADCNGDCNGTAIDDNCGVCNGDNSSCINYVAEIQPIFNQYCTNCHGSSGGLNLTSYSNLKTGGNAGPAVISENGSGSLLIQKLKGTASGSQMPISGCCLEETMIQLIETWINEGALNN